MLEALRDTAWQSILAFAGIIMAVIIYLVSRNRKELTCEVLTETALLSVAKGIAEKVQILYEGQQVSNVHLMLLNFANSGNVPILPNDFIENVRVEFGKGSSLLSFSAVDAVPTALTIELTPLVLEGMEHHEVKGVELVPVLLNPGDSFTIRALVSGYSGSIKVFGRIVGIKEIELRWRRPANPRYKPGYPYERYKVVRVRRK